MEVRMRCNIDGKIRGALGNLGAALMFNEMARVLMTATGNKILTDEDRMERGLAEAKKVLKRIAHPTPNDFDLAGLFDNAIRDIKWFFGEKEHYKSSYLSQEETKKLWRWVGKGETQEIMRDKTVFLEILIKTIEELERERKETKSEEVLFLIELLTIFWELLTYNKETTAHYTSVTL